MQEYIDILKKVQEKATLSYDKLPDIDLYMDQVIAYLSRQSVLGKDGEALTAAMVNNYIKDGLLPRAVDKKYNRDHLAYLIMISRLKQVLSVKDTALLLATEIKDDPVCDYFDSFQALLEDTAAQMAEKVSSTEALSELAVHLAVSGYVHRLACEAILDKLKETLPIQEEPKKAKSGDKQKKSENS